MDCKFTIIPPLSQDERSGAGYANASFATVQPLLPISSPKVWMASAEDLFLSGFGGSSSQIVNTN
jgi:hypothetical protein